MPFSPFLLSTYYTPGSLGTVLGTGSTRLNEVVIAPPSQDLQSRRKTLNHQTISQKGLCFEGHNRGCYRECVCVCVCEHEGESRALTWSGPPKDMALVWAEGPVLGEGHIPRRGNREVQSPWANARKPEMVARRLGKAFFFFFNFFSYLNWRINTLQWCVGFCHTAAWIRHRYTHVSSLLNLPQTPLGCHRARGWASVIYQLPTGYLCYIRYRKQTWGHSWGGRGWD